ncbi:MAG: peptide deformylase [Pseudomonadota bacterium]
MAILNIIYAPNPIFKQKAQPVKQVNDEIRKIANDMLETMYFEGAVGLGANMVAVPWQIIVIDLRENKIENPYIMINPQVIDLSEEMLEHEEASLSFPGISAMVKRPSKIKVKYLDLEDKEQTLEADGFLARVILHEMDYIHGTIFLDHISKLKKDMLLKKMQKFIRNHPPHVHGAHCNH